MQVDRISSKNKKFLDEARKMYREEGFEDMSNGRDLKIFIFQVRQVLVKSIAKDLARK